MSYTSATTVFLVLMTTMMLSQCQASYTFKVAPRQEECFVVTPLTHSTIHGNFELLDDELSARPLSILVTDSTDSTTKFRSRRGQRDGKFKVDAEPKEKVYICIQNGTFGTDRKKKKEREGRAKNDDLTRTVGLQLSVEERDVHSELHQTHSTILTKAVSLAREISRLQNHNEFMRTREAKHREVVEVTFSKLMRWTIAQCAGVVLLAVSQVMYLKRFLERRRYM
eukprot:scaffold1443_cov113-Cylindrotheca_fusiformis.AAC.6